MSESCCTVTVIDIAFAGKHALACRQLGTGLPEGDRGVDPTYFRYLKNSKKAKFRDTGSSCTGIKGKCKMLIELMFNFLGHNHTPSFSPPPSPPHGNHRFPSLIISRPAGSYYLYNR